MTKTQILKAFKKAKSKSDVCRTLEIPINGSGMRKINAWIDEFDIDVSHFDGGSSRRIKYPVKIRTCPVCGDEFETKIGNSEERKTCSYR